MAMLASRIISMHYIVMLIRIRSLTHLLLFPEMWQKTLSADSMGRTCMDVPQVSRRRDMEQGTTY